MMASNLRKMAHPDLERLIADAAEGNPVIPLDEVEKIILPGSAEFTTFSVEAAAALTRALLEKFGPFGTPVGHQGVWDEETNFNHRLTTEESLAEQIQAQDEAKIVQNLQWDEGTGDLNYWGHTLGLRVSRSGGLASVKTDKGTKMPDYRWIVHPDHGVGTLSPTKWVHPNPNEMLKKFRLTRWTLLNEPDQEQDHAKGTWCRPELWQTRMNILVENIVSGLRRNESV